MADEQVASGEAGGEGAASDMPAARKEIEGFKVVRAAPPPDQGPPVLAFVVVILVMVGLGLGAYALSNQVPEPEDQGGETGPKVTQPAFPPDAEVDDYVWERLEFMESEGNLTGALEFAEEHNDLTPHSKLRTKIAELQKELGLKVKPRTLEELLSDAEKNLREELFQKAHDDADEAVELDDSSGRAYYLRGVAKGRLDDKISAITDLETAIDLGYEADKARALIKQYAN